MTRSNDSSDEPGEEDPEPDGGEPSSASDDAPEMVPDVEACRSKCAARGVGVVPLTALAGTARSARGSCIGSEV